jgi:hypothetical protein
MPTIVRRELAELEIGETVRIVYKGTGLTKAGQEMLRFDVFTLDPSSADEETIPSPADDQENVPF